MDHGDQKQARVLGMSVVILALALCALFAAIALRLASR
jgi:hypothetical protein